MTPVYVLLNPTSGAGAALRRWRRLEPVARSVFGDLTVESSQHPGELRARAAAIASRTEPAIVLAAGGDGTSHEVVNGLIDAGTAHGTAMGWIPIGSGNDLARGTGLPLAFPACLEAYRDRTIARIDAGMIRFRSATGTPASLAFGNSFTLGVSVDVLEICRDSSKRLGGRLAYSLATVRAVARQVPMSGAATVDGARVSIDGSRILAVTNGPTVGAGMRLNPDARLDDGRFDLLQVGPLSRLRTLALFPRIFWGGHLGHPAVHHRPMERLEIAGDGQVEFEADGELVQGRLPLSVEILPAGLSILRPAAPRR